MKIWIFPEGSVGRDTAALETELVLSILLESLSGCYTHWLHRLTEQNGYSGQYSVFQ